MTVLEETAALLRSLRDVWDEEAVDELDHALQSAARAIDDGADDELVLAAALHDLAHSPMFDAAAAVEHDAAARELAGAAVRRAGRLAGRGGTSPPSATWSPPSPATGRRSRRRRCRPCDAQGGAGVDAALVAHPWWPDALRLRRYDDAAKDPEAGPNGGLRQSRTC